MNFNKAKYGTFVRTSLVDDFYVITNIDTGNKKVSMYEFDPGEIWTYEFDQGHMFSVVTKTDARKLGLVEKFREWEERQLMLDRQQELEKYPNVFARLKTMLVDTCTPYTVDIDGAGRPMFTFDFNGYELTLSYENQMWEFTDVFNELQISLDGIEAERVKREARKVWWNSLSPTDRDMFEAIYNERCLLEVKC